MMRKIDLPVLLTALILGLSAGNALAHGDEDHSQDAKKKTPAAATPAASSRATAGATAGATAAPQRLADGSLFVPKPVQRQLGLRTQVVRIAELAATVELNGRVVPDPETSGRVQAMFAGSVIPGPKGMPTAGRKVAKGEILAYLRPISGAIERANQKASLAELEAQLAIAKGKLKRFEQLEGAVPQREIEAARIEHAARLQVVDHARREIVRGVFKHETIALARAFVARRIGQGCGIGARAIIDVEEVHADGVLPEGQMDYPCASGVDATRRGVDQALQQLASGSVASVRP